MTYLFYNLYIYESLLPFFKLSAKTAVLSDMIVLGVQAIPAAQQTSPTDAHRDLPYALKNRTDPLQITRSVKLLLRPSEESSIPHALK